ncbi:MAG: diacylglycerol kinase family protein, partial [Bacteroidota bacterium]
MEDILKTSHDQWLIIVNPNAGVRKAARDWQKISGLMNDQNIPHTCVLTEHRDHANKLVGEFIQDGYRNIAIVGGDGTMNEVLNGIFDQKEVVPSEITLGIIPVGTGNDWCRTFSIPANYEEAIRLLKNKKTFIQDVGKISYFKGEKNCTRYFMNIAGMGYDALVANKTNLLKDKGKGGPLTYLYFVFAGLLQYRFIEAIIEVDDQQ